MIAGRLLSVLMVLAFLPCEASMREDAPGSLAAFFDGNDLRESLLKLTPASEASVRRLDRTLSQSSRFVRVEVMSLHESGALVSVKSYSSEEIPKDAPAPLAQPFFIFGMHEGLVKDAKWEGWVFPAGKFTYPNAEKHDETVGAFALSKEHAVRAMEQVTAASPK